MDAYFIGGLGCNPFYPQPFFHQLGLPVTYLDLYQEEIADQADLLSWFQAATAASADLILLAHSLGADMAVYLANQCSKVKKLILLDGGYLQMDRICSLQAELEDAEAYLSSYRFARLEEAIQQEKSQSQTWSKELEKAVCHSLRWDEDSQAYVHTLSYSKVKSLLSLRRQVQGQIQHLQQDCLLLIPQVQEDSPAWLRESLQAVPDQAQIQQLASVSHDLYVEQPQLVAQAVKAFLQD